jgi:hypothetical protein
MTPMMSDNSTAVPRWVNVDYAPSWRGSQIAPGLFMGGTADDDVVHVPAPRVANFGVAREYDAVVTLYAWAQPVPWEVEELRYGFGDGGLELVDLDRVVRAARWAWERWQSGDRVLVRCQAGLNRSGLVTALVLMFGGHTAADAIRLIRERRSSSALCNTAFERWLLTEAAEAVSAAA